MNEWIQTLTFPNSVIFSQARLIVPNDPFVWKTVWYQTRRHMMPQLICNRACKDKNKWASSSHKLQVVKTLFLYLYDLIHQFLKHIFGRARKGNSKGHSNFKIIKTWKKTCWFNTNNYGIFIYELLSWNFKAYMSLDATKQFSQGQIILEQTDLEVLSLRWKT